MEYAYKINYFILINKLIHLLTRLFNYLIITLLQKVYLIFYPFNLGLSNDES